MSPRLPRYVSPVLQIGQTSRTTHIDKLTANSTVKRQLTSERTTANRTNMQPFYFPCKRLQPTLIWHFCFDQKRTSSAISSRLSSTCLALLSRLYHGTPGIQSTFDKMGFDTAKKICSALTFFFPSSFFEGVPDWHRWIYLNAEEKTLSAMSTHTFSSMLQRRHTFLYMFSL